ncbi:MAG: hypothetical protein ACREB3_07520 [Burkholderiales bacterium]
MQRRDLHDAAAVVSRGRRSFLVAEDAQYRQERPFALVLDITPVSIKHEVFEQLN